MKTKYLSALFFLFFILSFSCIFAVNSEILTQKITSSINEQTKEITYTFSSPESALKIGKNDYWNIQPQTDSKKAYIKTDSNSNILGAEFTVNEKGDYYTFGNDKIYAPANSKVTYNGVQIIIEIPENSVLDKFPSYNPLNKDLIPNYIRISGKNLELPGGAILNEGYLLSENGELKSYRGAVINNVLFDNDVRLFFDGKKQSGITDSYVSLNPRDKTIYYSKSSGTSMTDLEFQEGNPFFDVRTGDYLKIQSFQFDELELAITNPEDKITNIDIVKKYIKDAEGYPKSFLIDGQRRFAIIGNRLILANYESGELGYVPLSISGSETGEKNPFFYSSFSDKQKNFVIFDDGRWAIFSKEESQYVSKDYHANVYPVENSPEEIQKALDSFKSQFRNLNLLGSEYITAEKILNAKETLQTLTPEMLASIAGLNFKETLLDTDSILKDGKSVSLLYSYNGLSSDAKGNIISGSYSDLAYQAGTIVHETAHNRHAVVSSNMNPEWEKIQPKEDYMTEKEQLLRHSKYDSYTYGFGKWDAYTEGMPLKGFISVYSAKKIQEDVAEFTMTVYTDPGIFKKYDLLNPKSPNYENGRYQKKLTLLLNYKFITQAQYDTIMEEAGLK